MEIAIEHVVSDIDLAIWVPPVKRWIGGVKDGFREFEPSDISGLVFPELLSGGRVGGSFVSDIVRIWVGIFFH